MKVKQEYYGTFIDLIHEHQGILHRLCSVYAPKPEDREDLYQEMLVQAWRSYPSYNGQSKFSTWLYRVALNTALFKRRKDSTRRDSVSDSEPPPDMVVPHESDFPVDVELLCLCIQQLSTVDRAIILLYLEQRTYKEIAEIMGLSRTNISVRIVRIKERLRTLLLARGYRED